MLCQGEEHLTRAQIRHAIGQFCPGSGPLTYLPLAIHVQVPSADKAHAGNFPSATSAAQEADLSHEDDVCMTDDKHASSFL